MSTFTTSDGLSLYYEDDGGDGLPLLCLAGLTRTARDFDYVAPHLNGVRMIRLDYRGRGQSEWASDWSTYSLPVECRDVMELLAHLGLSQVALLGTSRGGLNAMGLAAAAPDLLLGVALNDVGPDIDSGGIDFILTYLGRNPSLKTHEAFAAMSPSVMVGFHDVPPERWLQEARTHYTQTEDGLQITYDPHLRDAIAELAKAEAPDLWPFFDGFAGKPLAVIWGENSNLLKEETVQKMQARRPDMILGRVPGRGHVPFLDEPESLSALHAWLGKMT